MYFNKVNRIRIKINLNIDKELFERLDYISKKIEVPRSRIVDDGVRYVLKKGIKPAKNRVIRKPINLTVNAKLWSDLKCYAKENHYKLVYLIEEGLNYSSNKYKRKNFSFSFTVNHDKDTEVSYTPK